MPYTEALLRSLPRLSDATHTRLSAIPGRPPDLARRNPGCSFAPRCSYRTARCEAEEPALAREGGHGFACFNPLGAGARVIA
jgi:peptide/nickel transport system ATP-binding protein